MSLLPPIRQRGVALILVLSIIVLAAGLIVAFFTRSLLHRQIAASSGNQTKVEILAESAMEVVVDDLLREITAGSTVSTQGGVSIYTPSSNRTVIPYAAGVNRAVFPNLLKRSASGTAFYQGSDYSAALPAPDRASAAPTTGTSANLRSISRARWNAPLLMARQNPGTVGDYTPLASFTAPDWIIVTRGNVGLVGSGTSATVIGPTNLTSGSTSLQNPLPSNPNFAIGRFAYLIYDEGGLLDINVAGNRLPTADNLRRGRLHQALLTPIPGVVSGGTTAFLDWRSPATGTNASSTPDSGGLFDPKRDFVSAGRGISSSDQVFFNRQDLIAYVKAHPDQFTADLSALQYLSTFSREKNAPSWSPRTPAGSSIAYAANAEAATSANRNLANVRDSAGKPLLKQRFPLSRIAAVVAKSTDAATWFGLTWDATGKFWNYTHAVSTNQIRTLDEVRAAGREPDFFELLKAAILAGSLGKAPGSGPASTGGLTVSDLQIMQIGANIIDQYDSDDYPTEIRLGSDAVYGVENLPYLVRVFGLHSIDDPANSPNRVGGWLQPELWNPHQSGSTPSFNLRLRMEGTASTYVENTSGGDDTAAPTGNASIVFSASAGFASPTILVSTTPGISYSAPNSVTLGGTTHVAFHTGYAQVAVPHQLYRIVPQGSYKFILEYHDGSDYRPYSVWNGVNVQLENPASAEGQHAAFYVKADPRADRFGVSIGSAQGVAAGNEGAPGMTIRTGIGGGRAMASHAPANGFTWSSPTSFALGLLSDNLFGSDGYYLDNDGIARKADGAYRSGTEGLPLSPTSAGRGVVLNRPFRSVGELGYAFRDLPFKSLDFFTPESGDAGLLDVFTVDDAEVMAGRINLNTRNKAVLEAMLSEAGKVAGGGSASISAAEATAMANAIVAWTSDTSTSKGPLLNRADLVSLLATELASYGAAAADQANKERREAAARALADVANTRTWNLLIDLIAQTGRYPASATNVGSDPLNQKFIVEGECRYWLHLAIDRYTGEVVAKQLERVTE